MLALRKSYVVPVQTTSHRLTGLNYFLVVSATGALAAAVSATTGAAGVSTFGASTTGESVFAASLVSPSLLQATKATETIANAKITFFIFLFCLIFKNYNFQLIPGPVKGNPSFFSFFFRCFGLQMINNRINITG